MKDEKELQCQFLIEKGDQLFKVGDVYNAVKLFRKAVRINPSSSLGYERLSSFYHTRNEWKPAFHFAKKGVAIDPSKKDLWWILGVSAERLNKVRIAKSVWQKFGFSQHLFNNNPVAIKTTHDGMTEILLARAINPTIAEIINIPHPDNAIRFGDTVLFDRMHSSETVVISKMRLPVFSVKEKIKTAHYCTFSTTLSTNDPEFISKLEKMALSYNIGFEVWSNISLFHSSSKELHVNNPHFQNSKTIVAFASKNKVKVVDLLKNWTLITLENYSELINHHENN